MFSLITAFKIEKHENNYNVNNYRTKFNILYWLSIVHLSYVKYVYINKFIAIVQIYRQLIHVSGHLLWPLPGTKCHMKSYIVNTLFGKG